jgi:tetratricopeptide (TPR) repeat protein
MSWEENQREGELAFERGQYSEAERFFTTAIQEAASLNEEQAKLADSLYYLGKVYTIFEDFSKAESALTKALAIRGKAHGTEDVRVAETIEQIGTLYLNERKYAQAEPMLKRALEMRMKLFSKDSPEVAQSMASLGALKTSQNLLHDAESILKKALAVQETTLGPTHRELASTLGLLALCRLRRRDYPLAEQLARRALEIRTAEYGPEHPNVAMSLHILASTCMGQNKYDQAVNYYESALALRERFLTANHSGIISILRALGYCYLQEKDFARAEDMFRRLESLSFGQVGHVKEWTDAVRFLAQLLTTSRRYEEGEHYIYRAIDQLHQAHVEDEDTMRALLNSLVRCQLAQKKYVDAVREVPAIASMTFQRTMRKLDSSQSVTTLKELVGSFKRRTPAIEGDNNHEHAN